MTKRAKKTSKKRSLLSETGPPPIRSNIVVRRVCRWINGSALSAASITFQNLCDIMVVGGNNAGTTCNDLFASVRVRRVSIWGAPNSGGAASTVSVEFGSVGGNVPGVLGDDFIHSDTALGTTVGPTVHARPSKMSQCAQWQPGFPGSANNNVAFKVTVPEVGSIIELEYDGLIPGSTFVLQSASAAVAAAQGQVYQRALNGGPIAAGTYVSQGFIQI